MYIHTTHQPLFKPVYGKRAQKEMYVCINREKVITQLPHTFHTHTQKNWPGDTTVPLFEPATQKVSTGISLFV